MTLELQMKLNWFRVHGLTARSMGRHLPPPIEDYIALGAIYTSEITGSGGHAAHPHRSIDSVSAIFLAILLIAQGHIGNMDIRLTVTVIFKIRQMQLFSASLKKLLPIFLPYTNLQCLKNCQLAHRSGRNI